MSPPCPCGEGGEAKAGDKAKQAEHRHGPFGERQGFGLNIVRVPSGHDWSLRCLGVAGFGGLGGMVSRRKKIHLSDRQPSAACVGQNRLHVPGRDKPACAALFPGPRPTVNARLRHGANSRQRIHAAKFRNDCCCGFHTEYIAFYAMRVKPHIATLAIL